MMSVRVQREKGMAIFARGNERVICPVPGMQITDPWCWLMLLTPPLKLKLQCAGSSRELADDADECRILIFQPLVVRTEIHQDL